MSSIFNHNLAAVYRDRAYALGSSGSAMKLGAAFAIGAICTVGAFKFLPAGATDDAKAQPPKSVRVIAPNVVPPPANVVAATEKAKQDQVAAASKVNPESDNVGLAPRSEATASEFVATAQGTGASVPFPRVKPETEQSELKLPEVANASPAVPDAASASKPAVDKPVTRAERRAARKEARAQRRQEALERRAQRKEQRLAKRRGAPEFSEEEMDGMTLIDRYRMRDGRRVSVYRTNGPRALGFADEEPLRRGPFRMFESAWD